MDQRIVLYTRQNLNQCGLMSIIQMKSFKVILMNESTSDRQFREQEETLLTSGRVNTKNDSVEEHLT